VGTLDKWTNGRKGGGNLEENFHPGNPTIRQRPGVSGRVIGGGKNVEGVQSVWASAAAGQSQGMELVE